MVASLSDCTYDGVNNKIEVQNGLVSCTGGDTKDPGSPTTNAPSATGRPTTTAPPPTATVSNPDCVTNEINMTDQFTAAAKSDECAANSSVSATAIVISTLCDSSCASKLEELASSLPNCSYGYQSKNLTSDLLTQLDGCVGANDSYSINVTISPEEAATTVPDTNSTSKPTPAPTKVDPTTPSPTKGNSKTYC
ncbi:hypothetical protein PHYBOEH_005859 [Phytophthora boehmeriae]|uniref:Elicitin n=1 Tax=Phytophthora boehmeriae TaxID=109152 RepID=A0A8T1WQH2_9STRA|nr:hypothetical protein PHYBOEH_005859 [Phytophthora boehmeriae]